MRPWQNSAGDTVITQRHQPPSKLNTPHPRESQRCQDHTRKITARVLPQDSECASKEKGALFLPSILSLGKMTAVPFLIQCYAGKVAN